MICPRKVVGARDKANVTIEDKTKAIHLRLESRLSSTDQNAYVKFQIQNPNLHFFFNQP